MNPLSTSSHRRLLPFFVLTFSFSWLVWISMAIFPFAEAYFLPLLFLGAFGPAVSAITLLFVYGNIEERKSFFKRLINFRQIGVKWFLFIFLIFPAILITGYFIYHFFGGSYPALSDYFGGIENISGFLQLMGIMLIGGPLSEEPGWRGYALDPLQKKFGAVKASLILGIIWILWHLPLFFIEGTSQYEKGFGFAFWSWAFQLIVISFIFTFVYNRTGKSILAAIFLHLMANIAYPLNLDLNGEIVFTIFRFSIAVILILQLKSFKKQHTDLTITAS